MNYQAGQKIKFKEEKRRYTVRASSERFLVCTKPFNARKTVLYTLVDLVDGRRGTVNYLFNPYDFEKDDDCKECLADLESGKCGLSRRNNIELNIE